MSKKLARFSIFVAQNLALRLLLLDRRKWTSTNNGAHRIGMSCSASSLHRTPFSVHGVRDKRNIVAIDLVGTNGIKRE